MSVIYKAKILLKTGYGYPGNILDLGEAGYDISTNKFWMGNGIGNPPTGFTTDASFNYLTNVVNNISASEGYYTTFAYVDGSLNFIKAAYIPDSSLGHNFYWDPSHYLKIQELKGTVFPPSPSEGDQYFKTDQQLLFTYDTSRGKYLSVARPTYTFGRTTLNGGVSGYLTMDGASHSSTDGLIAPSNGTILSATVDNTNIITRNLEVRVNNVTKATLPLVAQKSNSIFNLNVDFSTGNILHIFSPLSPGNNLSNITFTINVAWR